MFDAIQSAVDLILKGGPVMLPIFLFSLGAMTIIFERLYYFHKRRENPEQLFNAVHSLISRGQCDQSLEVCKEHPGPVGRLLETGIQNRHVSEKKLEELLDLSAQSELKKMGKYTRALEVIATVSPLMGLLGTVIGMVQAFNKVAEYSGQVEPSLLAGGIWVALLTTAAGLAVAIPASIMSHYFDQKIEAASASLSQFGQKLIHALEEAPFRPANGKPSHRPETPQLAHASR
ncbi:MAG: MotA/TolQ/ExbB proton channel family protein [Candidatus Nitrohelix vancouverensis]|uniref:MotA/TolQ/ExbB proton channel family protein n=1 Tax=Candidatus Nitrohelix vancouverensis TaxID=2705534 RepID=A0A7T0C0A1_9BACT|nr:MAG: MotA/TolQ/ExbB proton channel family protein [Candidatus Nitrohelix vancouverensis]